MIPAILGGGFLDDAHGRFDPVSWLLGSGVGTNLGAALIGLLAGFALAWWKAVPEWRRHRHQVDLLEASNRQLLRSHAALHVKVDEITRGPTTEGDDDER